MKKLISIVAPMYNEEALVKEYCKETIDALCIIKEKYDCEIILVNDGSKDGTYANMIQEQKENPEIITTISLSRNFGLEGAVNAGLRMAKGDAVVVMDADLQDPPLLILEMVEKWENGADIVVGSRIKRSNDGPFKKLGANIYYKVMDSLSGKLKLEKSAANFRLLSREALDKILQLPEVNTVFRVVVPYVGMKTEVVEYDRDKRFAGKTKYSLKNMIPYALDSITGISVSLLRLVSYTIPLCFLVFLISMIAFCITSDGWRMVSLIIVAMSFFSGIILSGVAILSEYVAQIFIESKGRPTSIIKDYNPCGNVNRREKE